MSNRAETIRAMRDSGHTYAFIARTLGVSRQRVWQIVNPQPVAHVERRGVVVAISEMPAGTVWTLRRK